MKQENIEKIKEINNAIRRINNLYSSWAIDNHTNQYTLSILHMLLTEGEITQKKFSEEHEVPKQSVNNIILSLKKDNLIEMKTGKKDKREKIIVLTEKGKQHAEELLTPLLNLESNVIEKMGTISVDNLIESTITFGDILENEMKEV